MFLRYFSEKTGIYVYFIVKGKHKVILVNHIHSNIAYGNIGFC
jgi:hypothetical protein